MDLIRKCFKLKTVLFLLILPGVFLFASFLNLSNHKSTHAQSNDNEAGEVLGEEAKPEVIEKRSLASKTYDNGDGTYTMNSWGLPVHYPDENGDFQDIDTTIVPSTDPDYDYMNITNNTKTYFTADALGDAKNVKLLKGDASITMQTLSSLTVKNIDKDGKEITETQLSKEALKPDVKDKILVDQKLASISTGTNEKENKLTYDKLYEDGTKELDVSYIVQDYKLQEEIILNEFQGFPEITQEITLENAYAKVEGDEIYIYNIKTDEFLWLLPKPFMREQSDDNPLNYNYGLHYELTCSNEKIEIKDCPNLILTKVFDKEGQEWLSDPKRQYPVVVDPDYIGSTADGFVRGYDSIYSTARTTGNENYTSDLNLGQLRIWNNYYIVDVVFLVFDTSGIGSGNTVTQVNLKLTPITDDSATDFDVYILKNNWSGQNPITSSNRDTAFDSARAAAKDDNIWRNSSGVSTNTQYASGNLNTAWVSKTSSTYYSLMSDRVYNESGTPPTYLSNEELIFASQEHSTVAYRPVLTVTYSLPNSSPDTPTIDNYSDGAFTNDNTPTLQFDLSDPDASDTLTYNIQIGSSANFSGLTVDYTEGVGDTTPRDNVQYMPSALPDGSCYWRVRAIDNSDVGSSWATANLGGIAFKVDTTAPVTTDSGTDASWHNSNVTVSFDCTDTSGSGCDTTYYTTDGTDPTTLSSSGPSVTLSAEGTHTVKYFSQDIVDNSESVKTAENAVNIDKTNPSLTTVASTPSNTGGSITWNTISEDASSKVNYGLTASYGNATSEIDTSPRKAAHSVSLSGLLACTTYHYQAVSKDEAGNTGVSADKTFTTSGCTGSSELTIQTQKTITLAVGGTVTLTNALSQDVVNIVIPTDYTTGDAEIQIKELPKGTVILAASQPTGLTVLGEYVYDLKALTAINESVTNFLKPLAITLLYTDADIAGYDESSLKIYHYDGISWSALTSCVVDTSLKTVTCETSSFSIFALVGAETETPSGCEDIAPGPNAPNLFSAVAKNSNSIFLYFTKGDVPVDNYVLKYGTKYGEYNHKIKSMDITSSRGLITSLIKSLSANTTYYFKVRAGNGCAAGPWSNEISAKTPSYLQNLTNLDMEIIDMETNLSEESNQTNTLDSIESQDTIEGQVKGYLVKVKVVDANQNPVEGAKVTLHSTPSEAITDKEGIAVFENVEKGEHTVFIAYRDQEGEQKVNLVSDTSFTIQLKPSSPFKSLPVILVISTLALLFIGTLVLFLKKKG